VEAVRLRVILGLIISTQFATAQQVGVRWSTIDPFCGRVVSAHPESFPITSASVRLYRATEKHLLCCASAKQIKEFRIDKTGNFDSRRLGPGQYWMIVGWRSVEVPVALWSDGKHDFACNENYRNIIKIDATEKTAEISIVDSTNALNDAQTH
jgi:hypothetical protein